LNRGHISSKGFKTRMHYSSSSATQHSCFLRQPSIGIVVQPSFMPSATVEPPSMLLLSFGFHSSRWFVPRSYHVAIVPASVALPFHTITTLCFPQTKLLHWLLVSCARFGKPPLRSAMFSVRVVLSWNSKITRFPFFIWHCIIFFFAIWVVVLLFVRVLLGFSWFLLYFFLFLIVSCVFMVVFFIRYCCIVVGLCSFREREYRCILPMSFDSLFTLPGSYFCNMSLSVCSLLCISFIVCICY